ncbi:MAG: Hsp20/alpha crystallin family protein [Peptococcaceae bacterium]
MFGLVPFGRKGSVMQSRHDDEFFSMERIWDDFFRDGMLPALYTGGSQMRVDIRETEKEFILEAELPGVKKENVHLEVTADRLLILVREEEEKEENRSSYLRKERRFTALSRSFAITNIAQDKISAKMENGILTVTLPKAAEDQPQVRKIDIN